MITRSTVMLAGLAAASSTVAVTLSAPFFSALTVAPVMDLHALLLELLLGEGGDLLVLDRQDPVGSTSTTVTSAPMVR